MPAIQKLPHLRGRHLVLIDAVAVALAVAVSLTLWADIVASDWTTGLTAAVLVMAVRPGINIYFGMYGRIWRHASVPELWQVSRAVAAGSLVAVGLFYLVLVPIGLANLHDVPRSFWIVEGLVSLALLGGTRYAIRAMAEHWRPAARRVSAAGVPTILYGAGHAGMVVVRSARDPRAGVRPVGFLDDDDRLRGQAVAGLRVFGGLDRLPQLAEETGARRLLITMPEATSSSVRRIVHAATALGLEVRTLPLLHEFLDGSVDAYKIRRVKVEDLLRRPAVREHQPEVAELISDKVVMITGAGGSIGSELARQVFALRPAHLVLVDRAEGPLYGIQRELDVMAKRVHHREFRLSTHIANVATRTTMQRLVQRSSPDIIFHAAAYKHVPMMEEHPSDAVHVNIGGTMSVVDAAEACNVPNVVFVSTDKAVRPSSVMGATKRVAEAIVGSAAQRTDNRFVSVRFGNVLGSSGSVVPIFQQQLESGEPLTVTHRDMTRYFMTIPEAVWLILDAAAIGTSGSLLVLDMGEPVRILDLAHDLIRLSGRDPASVPIEFTGLRPGEKLHEELFYASERVMPTDSPKVMRAEPQALPLGLHTNANELISLATGDQDAALRAALFALTDLLEQEAGNRLPVERVAPQLVVDPRPHARSASRRAPAPTPATTGTADHP